MTGGTHAIGRRGFIATLGTSALGGVLSGAPSGARDGGLVGVGAHSARPWIPDAAFLGRLPSLMRLARVPGLTMAVVEHGAIAWSGAFGIVRADRPDAATEATLFEAASISKAVFAYAVLRLAERGAFDLDQPLAAIRRPEYLPSDAAIDRITARHVLSHSSGLPNWGDDAKPESLRPAFEPGTSFRYSGEGIFWLQLVVERLTGLGLDAFMRRELFVPAGMHQSSFAWDSAQLPSIAFGHRDGRVVAGHGTRPVMELIQPRAERWGKPVRDWIQEDWIRVATELDPTARTPRVRFTNAAGSMLTTARDLARFAALVGSHAPRATWELSERMRTAMLAPSIAVRDDAPYWWGLGWAVERTPDGLRVGHEGNNDGLFASYLGVDPAEGRALVVLTNAGSGFGLYQRIVRELTGYDQLSFMASI